MDLWLMGLAPALLGLVVGGRRPERRRSRVVPHRDLAAFAGPPPKVVIRPVRTAGTVLVAYEAGGLGLQAASGRETLRVDPRLQVRDLRVEVGHGEAISSQPVQSVKLTVRNLPSETISEIGLSRHPGGWLVWTLNGEEIEPFSVQPADRGAVPRIGLPREFFGELLGLVVEDQAGRLGPRIVIEW
jgi:hypothetical protein